MSYLVDENGYYGEFGGAYVPEILHGCVENLQQNYLKIIESESFRQEYMALLRDYVGRPSPLYYASRLSDKYGASGVSVSTSVETNTQLVNVTVPMTSPEEAYAVARAIAEVAPVAVAELLLSSLR